MITYAMLCPLDGWLVRLATGWRLPLVEPAGGPHGAYSVVLTRAEPPGSETAPELELELEPEPRLCAYCGEIVEGVDLHRLADGLPVHLACARRGCAKRHAGGRGRRRS
jgi:hypothetical protein